MPAADLGVPARLLHTGPSLDFAAIRAEFALPAAFPPAVLAEAEEAATTPFDRGAREDVTDLPLVTIDPPGARDLDQALCIQTRPEGFRVHYAIADLGAFVRPGGAVDREARRRGQTLYLPDGNVPLHPPVLSEGAASLLPGRVRPAVLWSIDLDRDGEPDLDRVRVRRALVRSVARLDYASVGAALDAGCAHPSVAALPAVGRLRRKRALRRGAIELDLPEQEIRPDGDGRWRLATRPRPDVETWNAEISLLTGMVAAQVMLRGGVGVLRTVPEPDERLVTDLRHAAAALGVPWPEGAGPAEVLAGLDATRPEVMALYADATRLLRGAGYTAFDGAMPEVVAHAGVGAPYAHVTAPLRRLVDRFATEVCLAVVAGVEVPGWVREALPDVPGWMESSDRLAAQVERACLDQVAAWVLADRVGQEFDAVVLRTGSRSGSRSGDPVTGAAGRDGSGNGTSGQVGSNGNGSGTGNGGTNGGTIFVLDPPVMGRCRGGDLSEGERVRVRLVEVNPGRRRVEFARV
ncbi:MAG TPA: RNB domain-containing ribonuclease [Pseudonocardiaceae bacterium]